MLELNWLKEKLANLSKEGIFIGTSSWKYPGWCGLLYQFDRYVTRGKFSTARFERTCLAEYAQVFKTVCVDAAYYKFPEERYLAGMISQVPSDFQFSFKVTDEITVKRFPNLPRFGPRAGGTNPNYLNADLFAAAFAQPFGQFRENVGLFIFEFSRFQKTDYQHGREFANELDQFLERLPKGWRYGVELRNPGFLHPDYFALLRRHGVAHIFNSWSRMMPVDEQLEMPESLTAPAHVGARLLLRPGRTYAEAVKLFSPYNDLKEPNLPARSATLSILQSSLIHHPRRQAYVYINNRLEGNAIKTIMAILDAMNAVGGETHVQPQAK